MNKTSLLAYISGIAVTATLVGCSQSSPPPEMQRQVGMANPASVYCLSKKGQLESVKTAEGETLYCTLPSGERIDEWVLFHRDHPQK